LRARGLNPQKWHRSKVEFCYFAGAAGGAGEAAGAAIPAVEGAGGAAAAAAAWGWAPGLIQHA